MDSCDSKALRPAQQKASFYGLLPLLLVLASPTAVAADIVRTSALVIVGTEYSHNSTHECTSNVCSLPTLEPLPIPYPTLETSVIDGRLVGLGRLEGNPQAGTDSFTFAHLSAKVEFKNHAITVLAEDSPIILADIHAIRADASFHTLSRAQGGDVETTASATLLSNAVAGGVADQWQDTFVVGGSASSLAISEDFARTLALLIPFSPSFELGWSFETQLSVGTGASFAENDFSSTFQFTSLRFYDVNNVDVTQWVNVTFADGMTIANPVPEPETYAMLLAGLGMLGFAARRRKLRETASA